MSVAKVIEINAASESSFEDAVRAGLAKAATSVHGIQSAWINEQTVRVDATGNIEEFRVNMRVTFLLD
ncbi:MAG TPA: dodecin family protein [Conexibacter sp.]|nr:dodecin family protein [Conexibacter sp.]